MKPLFWTIFGILTALNVHHAVVSVDHADAIAATSYSDGKSALTQIGASCPKEQGVKKHSPKRVKVALQSRLDTPWL